MTSPAVLSYGRYVVSLDAGNPDEGKLIWVDVVRGELQELDHGPTDRMGAYADNYNDHLPSTGTHMLASIEDTAKVLAFGAFNG